MSLIDPRNIKIKKKEPLVKLDVYRARMPKHDAPLTLPADSLYGQDLVKVLKHDIDYNLADFIKFLETPGKYKLNTEDGHYICTSTNIYFISTTNMEKPVSVTKMFGLYLIYCDKGEHCWFEEIK